MERYAGRWQAVALVAAITAGAGTAGAQQQPQEPAGDAVFSADVTVERAVVDGQGRLQRELPRSRYRIERFSGGRSRMVMLATTPEPRVGPMADAYAGLVVEFDAAAGGVRVLGKDGRPLPGAPPLTGNLMPVELTEGGDNALVLTDETTARRRDLTRQFGSRVGTLRRMERYLTKAGNRVQEVLVAPATALPIEVNVVEGGVLEERHEFEYENRGRGRLVRTRMRSESRLPGATNERLVSVTTLSDVRMAGGVE